MQQIIPYIIKLSISLSVVYLFYLLVLRRLTFYNWNRWYLLFYSVAAFIIPLININPFLEQNDWQSNQMIEIIPAVGYQVLNTDLANESVSWSVGNWTSVLIVMGMAVMLCRLIVQHWSFRNIRSKSTLLIDDQVKVYQVNKEIIPFSFGNSIFINQYQHSEEELKEIIRHEFVHVKQKHSIDILWSELLCIINWYNPFAWLIRKSIRQNLEFIADNKVIENGLDKKQYQYMLLKVVGVSQYSIATQFNFSSLKKRIAMMNKIKSAKFHLVKFLFILPMLAVVLLAFRNQMQEAGKFSAPSAPTPSISTMPSQSYSTDTAPGKAKLPKEVKSISVQNDKVTVKLINGKIEKFDLSKPEEEAAFDKKYGKILPPPPPPPPPPPEAKSPQSQIEKEVAPEAVTVKGYPVAPTAPIPVEGHPLPPTPPNPPAPPEKNKKGNYISIADAEGDCIVIVRNKDRKIIKTITLEEWNQKETEYKNLYGDIPPVSNRAPEENLKGAGDYGIIQAPTSNSYQISAEMKLAPKLNGSADKTVNVTTLNTDPNILYILDGVKMTSQSFELKNIDPNTIDNIQVLKAASAEELYGAEGKSGVIVIVTKKFKAASVINNPLTLNADGGVNIQKLEDYKGIIIVDGVDYTSLQFKEMNIAAERVESVQVWKGQRAIEKFGEKAKEGVIELKLKK